MTEYPDYPLLMRYAGVRGDDLNLYDARILFRSNQHVSMRPNSFYEANGVDLMDFDNIPEDDFEFLIFTRSTLLAVRVGTDFYLEPYYPNRFARQFGFDQGVPTNKLGFPFDQRGKCSIEKVAKAQFLLLRRNTGAKFHIPSMSRMGTCTWWYCRY